MQEKWQNMPHRRHLLKWLKVFVIVLVVFFIIKIVSDIKSYGYIGEGITPTNVITVSGTGDVLATPDIAEFNFSVSNDAATAASAESSAATTTNAIIAALTSAGVATADIKTTDYNLSPKYAYQNGPVVCPQVATANGTAIACPPYQSSQLVGYTVTESVDVKVRNIDSAGALLAQVTTLGGDQRLAIVVYD